MNELASQYYEFSHFCVDGLRRMLLREGSTIPLPPKAFETLLALVQNSGRVMTKQELIERIWPDSFVEENNLAQHIFILRKALGDEKGEHRYIVTVPGRGYGFVAPVQQSTEAEARRRPGSKSRLNDPRQPSVSIGVLPFKPIMSPENDLCLGIGLADSIIMKLSGVKGISVRPTTSILKYIGAEQDPLAIGGELNVELVLDGIYQRDGDQVRVTAHLIRIKDGATLWAARFDDNFANLFVVQDSIAEQVARVFALKLSVEERRQLRKSYTSNAEKFQLYVRKRYFWNKRTTEGLKKGIEFVQQVLAIDQTYTAAYIVLAESHCVLAGFGNHPKDNFPKARAAALDALLIDENLAEARTVLGFVCYRFDWDWAAAEDNFKRAIQLKPGYHAAHHWYGEFLAVMCRFEESFAALKTALELDPLSISINADLALSYLFARRYEECEEQLLKTLEMDNNFARAHIFYGMLNMQKGKPCEAIANLQRAVEISDANPLALSMLGQAYALRGKVCEARQLLNTLLQLSEKRYVSAYNIATLYLSLHEKEAAFNRLDKAIEDKDVWLAWLKVDPVFDEVRADEKYLKLLSAVNLPLTTPRCAASMTTETGHGSFQ